VTADRPWSIDFPERLNEVFAHLSPGERHAIYDALKLLADDPRAGAEEPVTGAELRRQLTAPAEDSGGRVTILYRIHDDETRLELIWFLAGP